METSTGYRTHEAAWNKIHNLLLENRVLRLIDLSQNGTPSGQTGFSNSLFSRSVDDEYTRYYGMNRSRDTSMQSDNAWSAEIAKLPKAQLSVRVTEAQIASCGLTSSFWTISGDFVSAPARANMSFDFGDLPMRFDCKVRHSVPWLLACRCTDGRRRTQIAFLMVRIQATKNRRSRSALRFLSNFVILQIFNLLHEPRAVCLRPTAIKLDRLQGGL